MSQWLTDANNWAFGANDSISDPWPKPYAPFSSAVWSIAGVSVCCANTSAPSAICTLAASASFPGSYQVKAQTIFVLIFGLTYWAAKVNELIPLITSGIGKDAT